MPTNNPNETPLTVAESDDYLILRMTTADHEQAHEIKNAILDLCLQRGANALIALSAARCAVECFESMINERGGEVVTISEETNATN